MGEKEGIGNHMAELDDIVVHDSSPTVRTIRARRVGENFPYIVRVVKRVARHLLTLARDTAIIVAEGIFLIVAVQEDLGVLVFDRQMVIVENIEGRGVHNVVAQGLLEFGGHEVVARARPAEDGKMDLEPEEVEEEGDNYQTNGTSNKVLAKGDHVQCTLLAVDVQESPQIDADRRSDGDENESTHVLDRDDTAHAKASHQQPFPPLPAERLMSLLVESHVAQDRGRHEEDESCIEQYKPGLANV